tara:strand:+ start:1861 stop:6156 length:4296 start_codon:yes stop_codon:yes gene_type:complete
MGDFFESWNDFNDSPIGQIGLAVLNYYVPGAGFALQAGVAFADNQINSGPGAESGGDGSFAANRRGRTQSVRQAIGYRKFLYGDIRVGADFTLIHQTNSNREQHYLFTLSGHPVDSITGVYANGEYLPLDGNGEPVSGNKYRGHLQFWFGDGTIPGDADLQAALVANTDGLWTSSHRQRHCAKVYVWVKSWSNTVFPSGFPNFSFQVRGKKLFDPRVAGATISTSGSGATPLITTTGAHGAVAGDIVFIQGHSGSTPEISGFYEVLSAPTSTTCTLQLYAGKSVTVTGSGGTLHTCAWSDNAALMIADYLITAAHRGGFGADYASEVDESLLITAANACENRVAVAGEKVAVDSVDTGADTVDLAAAKTAWATGDGVRLQTTGTLPDPLAVDTDYYLVKTDDDTFLLASTIENAFGESTYDTGTVAVTNGDATVTGTGTAFTADVSPGDRFVRDGDGVSYTVDIVTDDTHLELTENYDGATGSGLDYAITLIDTPVTIDLTDAGTGTHTVERLWSAFTHDTATDEIVLSQDERAWLLADTVELASAGTLPAPLADSTDYFIVPVAGSPNRIRLATSRANAIAGTYVDITGSGSGLFYIRRTEEIRYAGNGVLSTEPTQRKNFEELLTASVADLVYVGGKYKITAGVWRAPSLSIGASELRGPLRMETGLSREKHFNTIKGLYIGPASVNQLDDYPPVIDTTALAEDDGETFAGEQNFPFTNSPTMASRCARILLRRRNKPKTIALSGKLSLWRHEPVDVVNVDYARFGLSSAPFQVSDATLSVVDQDGAPLVIYDMILRETASSVYDHDPDDEIPPAPSPSPTFPDFEPPPPTALSFAPADFANSTGGGVLSWTASDDGFVEVGGRYLVNLSSDGGVSYRPEAVTGGTQVSIAGLVPGSYIGQVIAVAAESLGGAESEPANFAFSIAVPPVLDSVSGLEFRGEGANGTVFGGRDAKFVWRAASVQGSYEIGAEPNGGDDGYTDPYFRDYEVRILKPDETVIRVEHTLETFFDYTFEKNAEDYAATEGAAGAYRAFTIEVYRRGNQNQISAVPGRMSVSNPSPAAPAGLTVTASFDTVAIDFTPPADLDYQGVAVHMSTSSSFTPALENKVGAFPSDAVPIFITRDPDTTYYVQIAGFDAFGQTGLNYSSEYEVSTGQAGTEYIADAAIGNAQISDLSAGKLTAGSIDTPLITLGTAGNIEIDGPNQRIRIEDSFGTTRLVIGKTGAGGGDWGIEAFDVSGVKNFDLEEGALNVDGANIQNATIPNAAIGDAEIEGAKIALATILQANIGVAAVGRLNLDDGSVSNAASNSSGSNTSISTTEATVLSQAITSDGGEIAILARIKIFQATNGSNQVRVRLKEGTTELDKQDVSVSKPASFGEDTAYVSFALPDTPGSGSKTYSITVDGMPAGGSITGTVQAQTRALFMLEVVK